MAGKVTGLVLEAKDRKAGMTLAEVREFLAICDSLGVGDPTVRIQATWRGSIRTMSVRVEAST